MYLITRGPACICRRVRPAEGNRKQTYSDAELNKYKHLFFTLLQYEIETLFVTFSSFLRRRQENVNWPYVFLSLERSVHFPASHHIVDIQCYGRL